MKVLIDSGILFTTRLSLANHFWCTRLASLNCGETVTFLGLNRFQEEVHWVIQSPFCLSNPHTSLSASVHLISKSSRPINMIQVRLIAGQQGTHWDKTNKELTPLIVVIYFVLFSQCVSPCHYLEPEDVWSVN